MEVDRAAKWLAPSISSQQHRHAVLIFSFAREYSKYLP